MADGLSVAWGLRGVAPNSALLSSQLWASWLSRQLIEGEETQLWLWGDISEGWGVYLVWKVIPIVLATKNADSFLETVLYLV